MSAPTCWRPASDAAALAAAAGARLRDGENWEDLFFRLLLERDRAAIWARRIRPS